MKRVEIGAVLARDQWRKSNESLFPIRLGTILENIIFALERKLFLESFNSNFSLTSYNVKLNYIGN